MEIKHPGQILQQELNRKQLTQKEFAKIVGKKVSEVNELIKGKRNITVQRDILLSAFFDEPEKKWMQLQMNYDYTLGKKLMDSKKIREIRNRGTKTIQEAQIEKKSTTNQFPQYGPEKSVDKPSKIQESTLPIHKKKKSEYISRKEEPKRHFITTQHQSEKNILSSDKEITAPNLIKQTKQEEYDQEIKKEKSRKHDIFIRF